MLVLADALEECGEIYQAKAIRWLADNDKFPYNWYPEQARRIQWDLFNGASHEKWKHWSTRNEIDQDLWMGIYDKFRGIEYHTPMIETLLDKLGQVLYVRWGR